LEIYEVCNNNKTIATTTTIKHFKESNTQLFLLSRRGNLEQKFTSIGPIESRETIEEKIAVKSK
jgi:hypothetical protein